MTLEELKRNWDSLDVGEAAAAETLGRIEERIRSREVSTWRDRIAAVALRICIIALVAPLLFIPLWVMSPAMVILATLFLLTCSAMQFYFYRQVNRIDYCRSTVTETLRQTIRCEQLRSRIRLIGMILGFPIIVMMLWVFSRDSDPYILIGGASGAVVGAVIGLIINHRLSIAFRRMKEELDSIQEEEE